MNGGAPVSLCAVGLTLRDVGLLTSGPTDSARSETVNDDKRYKVRHLTSADRLLLHLCDFFFFNSTFTAILYTQNCVQIKFSIAGVECRLEVEA